MKIVTLNCNGIRAAARKGFYGWMEAQDADFIALQETKAQEHQLPLEAAGVAHYTGVFLDAERKGYSGVAIYARNAPERVVRGLGWEQYDREARWLQLDYGSLSIVSLYVPSGSMGPPRQAWKDAFLSELYGRLAGLREDGRSYVIAGDFNVAHREIDVYDPVRCSRISGFLPHERAWMDRVLGELGWVDAFRVADPSPRKFTYWSNFRNDFERNSGWRIDYQLVTPDLRASIRGASIYTEQRFSDHAPVSVEYAL